MALSRAGFPAATIGHAETGISGTRLDTIRLGTVPEVTIDSVRMYASWQDLLGLAIGRAEFSGVTMTLETPEGPLPLRADATVLREGVGYVLKGGFSGSSPFAAVSGVLSGGYDGVAAKVQADIHDGKLDIEHASLRRLSGWVAADVLPALTLSAQLDAGSLRLFGLPIQGVTATAAHDTQKTTLLLNGKVAHDGGAVSGDVIFSDGKLLAHADITLENLDAIGQAGLRGRGKASLSFSALQADGLWRDISGTVGFDAKSLSLPGLMEDAEAAGVISIGYDPDTAQILADTDGAGYSDRRVLVNDVSGKLRLIQQPSPALDGAVSIKKIEHREKPAYVVPLKADLRFSPLGSGVTQVAGALRGDGDAIVIDISGKHDSEKGAGHVALVLKPLKMAEGQRSLADVFPIGAAYVTDAYGTLGMTASLAWQKDKPLSSSGEMLVRDMKAVISGGDIAGINTVLKLQSLMPLAFTRQSVSVGMLNVGLPLTNGLAMISLDKKGIFTLHEASWQLAGGAVSSSPFSTLVESPSAEVTLTAKALDLPTLFTIAPMEGLDATGTVNGTLPIKISPESFAIVGGVLESAGGGFIRYNPQQVPAFLADENNKQIADLRVALKAFEYESLKMTVDGELGKQQKIGLSIRGKNKNFYEGHPVAFNLNVEGPLQSVLKYNPGGSQIPDSIKKQLEEYEKKHAKQ